MLWSCWMNSRSVSGPQAIMAGPKKIPALNIEPTKKKKTAEWLLTCGFVAGGGVFCRLPPSHCLSGGTAYAELSKGLAIEVDFVHFAAYSPWMNVVEYGIHWLRQRYLHQAASEQVLADVALRLTQALANHYLLNAEQIINISSHIERETPRKMISNHSP